MQTERLQILLGCYRVDRVAADIKHNTKKLQGNLCSRDFLPACKSVFLRKNCKSVLNKLTSVLPLSPKPHRSSM